MKYDINYINFHYLIFDILYFNIYTLLRNYEKYENNIKYLYAFLSVR